MSTPARPRPVKPVASLIAKDPGVIGEALEKMAEELGPVDFLSEEMAFDHTDYYSREMGSPLVRRVASFAEPVDPGKLPDMKLFTNRLEEEFSRGGKRRVNIDPGVLSPGSLVLATGKGYSHRIYLKDGIYADLTLMYKEGEYRPLEWTYPDYAGPRMREIFGNLRRIHLRRIR